MLKFTIFLLFYIQFSLIFVSCQNDMEFGMFFGPRVQDPNRPPGVLTDIYILYDRDTLCAQNYIKYNQDLNEAAGGKYIWLCYTNSTEFFDPITNLTVIQSGFFDSPSIPNGYKCVRDVNIQCGNLNSGTFGERIYLAYTRDISLNQYVKDFQIIRQYVVPNDTNTIIVPINLNQDTLGDPLFFEFTVVGPITNASNASSTQNLYLFDLFNLFFRFFQIIRFSICKN